VSCFYHTTKVEHAFSLFSSIAHHALLVKTQKLAYLAIAAPQMPRTHTVNTRKERNDDDYIADHYHPCSVFDRSNPPH